MYGLRTEMNILQKNPGRTQLELSLSMGGGGVKELHQHNKRESLNEVMIDENTSVILLSPDTGQMAKDEYFIPNLHNGLFRISAFLFEHGIHNTLLCTDTDNMVDAWDLIERYHPPFIGFSPYYNTMYSDIQNMYKISQISPNSLVIAGGFEASLNEQWLQLGNVLDIVILGEGEFALLQVIKNYHEFLKNHQQDATSFDKTAFKLWLKDVYEREQQAGLYILDTGKILYFKPLVERISQETYQDINLLAFHKHLGLSPIQKYWDISQEIFEGTKDTYFRFVSSDHCPHKCIFCQSSIYYSHILGKKNVCVKYLEAENIIKILKTISDKYPFISHIYIDDENFLTLKKRALITTDLIIKAKNQGMLRHDLKFLCRARTDNIKDDICQKLKAAGFETVSIGSESYSAAELEYMRKKVTPETNRRAVQTLRNADLQVAENYILYTPETTAETFFDTVQQIYTHIVEFGIDGAATLFLTPLPGTSLWDGGDYKVLHDFPFKHSLFKDKVMFKSVSNGFEYIGSEISVLQPPIKFAHPEIMLVRDPFMREISLQAILDLPENISTLRTSLKEPKSLSRRFITLTNIFSAINLIYDYTNQEKWGQLKNSLVHAIKTL